MNWIGEINEEAENKIMKDMTAKEAYETGSRYRGFILYADAGDGTYWVSGREQWMTQEELDTLLSVASIGEQA
jgi:hypothetical protein